MDDQTINIKRSLLSTYRDRVAAFPDRHAAMIARHEREMNELNDEYLRAVEQIPVVQAELEAIKKQVELERNEKYQQLQKLMAQAAKLAAEINHA